MPHVVVAHHTGWAEHVIKKAGGRPRLLTAVSHNPTRDGRTARVVEDDPELTARLFPEAYRARAEQAIVFAGTAIDINCPQHIPQRFDAADVAAALGERDRKIAGLEAEIAELHLAAARTT